MIKPLIICYISLLTVVSLWSISSAAQTDNADLQGTFQYALAPTISSRIICSAINHQNGDVYCGGFWRDTLVQSDVRNGLLFALDENNDMRWALSLNDGGTEYITDVASNGQELFVTGVFTDNASFYFLDTTLTAPIFTFSDNNSILNDQHAFTASLNLDGSVNWVNVHGGVNNDVGLSIECSESQVFTVIGFDNFSNDVAFDGMSVPAIGSNGSYAVGFGQTTSYALISESTLDGTHQWTAFIGSNDDDLDLSDVYNWDKTDFRQAALEVTDTQLFVSCLVYKEESIYGSDNQAYNFGLQGSFGDDDALIASFDHTGIPQWKRMFFQDTGEMSSVGLAADCNGLYSSFSIDTDQEFTYRDHNGSKVDFETSHGTGYAPVITKLDLSTGLVQWVNPMQSDYSGVLSSPIYDLACDALGHLYFCGTLNGLMHYNIGTSQQSTRGWGAETEDNIYFGRVLANSGIIEKMVVSNFDRDEALFTINPRKVDLFSDAPVREIFLGGSIEHLPIFLTNPDHPLDRWHTATWHDDVHPVDCCSLADAGTMTTPSPPYCEGSQIKLSNNTYEGYLRWEIFDESSGAWQPEAEGVDTLWIHITDTLHVRTIAYADCFLRDTSAVETFYPEYHVPLTHTSPAASIDLIATDCNTGAQIPAADIPSYSSDCHIDSVRYMVPSFNSLSYSLSDLSTKAFPLTFGSDYHTVLAVIYRPYGFPNDTCTIHVTVSPENPILLFGCGQTTTISADEDCLTSLPYGEPSFYAEDCDGNTLSYEFATAVAPEVGHGAHVETIYYTSLTGLRDSCDVTFDVTDVTKPQIVNCDELHASPPTFFTDAMSCQPDITFEVKVLECQASMTVVQLLDQDSTILTQQSISQYTGTDTLIYAGQFSGYGIGEYVIRAVVYDLSNQSDTCTYSVSVLDHETADGGLITKSPGPYCEGDIIFYENTTSAGNRRWQSYSQDLGLWEDLNQNGMEISLTITGSLHVRLIAETACGSSDTSQTVSTYPVFYVPISHPSILDTIALTTADCGITASIPLSSIPTYEHVCHIDSVRYFVNDPSSMAMDTTSLANFEFSVNTSSNLDTLWTVIYRPAPFSHDSCLSLVEVEQTQSMSMTGCGQTFELIADDYCQAVLPMVVDQLYAIDCNADTIQHTYGASTNLDLGLGSTITDVYFESNGLVNSCPVTFLVKDLTAPIIANSDELSGSEQEFYTTGSSCTQHIPFEIKVSECNEPTLTITLDSLGIIIDSQTFVASQGVSIGSDLISFSGTFLNKGIGLYTIKAISYDAENQSDDCSYQVRVLDGTSPLVITCLSSASPLLVNDQCAFYFDQNSLPVSSFHDNCSPSFDLSYSLDSAGVQVDSLAGLFQRSLSPGTYVLHTYASNGSSDAAHCETNIHVYDNEAPQITCPDRDSIYVSENSCTAIYTPSIPVITDNCTVQDFSWSLHDASGNDLSGQELAPGAYLVTFQATDLPQNSLGQSNTATCTQEVLVIDALIPMISCPSDTLVQASVDLTSCSALVSIEAPNVLDNCSNYSISYALNGDSSSLGSGLYPFQLGENLLHFYVHDSISGHQVSCSTEVLVSDTTSLHPLCPAELIFDMTDSTACTENISILDSIRSHADYSLAFASCSDPFSLEYSWERFHNGTLVDSTGLNEAQLFSSGSTQVQLYVTDSIGQQGSCEVLVTLLDPIPPIAIAVDSLFFTYDGSPITVTPADVDAGSSDNCSIASMSLSEASFDSIGEYVIYLTVIDSSAHISFDSTHVTISDGVLPVAICNETLTVALDSAGLASITPEDVNLNSADNSGFFTLAISETDFSCQDLGASHVVVLTVTDGNENQQSCQSTVDVLNYQIPQIECSDDVSIQTAFCAVETSHSIDIIHNCPIEDSDINWTIQSVQLNGTGSALEVDIPVGVHELDWSLAAPYESIECSSTIHVIDTLIPLIACDSVWSFCMDDLSAFLDSEPLRINTLDCEDISLTSSPALGEISPSDDQITWTISDGLHSSQCTTALEITELASQAYIGDLGEITLNSEFELDSLPAAHPLTGLGYWTVDQGSALIDDPSLSYSSVQSLGLGTNILTWTVSNEGCGDNSESLFIHVNSFHIPSGFSPNGDATNEYFNIRGLPNYPKNTFTVMNRWGVTVFQTESYQNDWNGVDQKGRILPSDTYYYTLRVQDLDDKAEQVFKGFIELKR